MSAATSAGSRPVANQSFTVRAPSRSFRSGGAIPAWAARTATCGSSRRRPPLNLNQKQLAARLSAEITRLHAEAAGLQDQELAEDVA